MDGRARRGESRGVQKSQRVETLVFQSRDRILSRSEQLASLRKLLNASAPAERVGLYFRVSRETRLAGGNGASYCTVCQTP